MILANVSNIHLKSQAQGSQSNSDADPQPHLSCACAVAGEGYDREAVFHYAEQVAAGFRQPFPPHWPQKIRALIADCWHQARRLSPGQYQA